MAAVVGEPRVGAADAAASPECRTREPEIAKMAERVEDIAEGLARTCLT